MTLQQRSDQARAAILERLRATAAPFEDAPPRPDHYLNVSRAPDGDLAERFKAEIERLNGYVHIAQDTEAAIETVLKLLDGIDRVMAWDALPLPGLVEALAGRQITQITPRARGGSRSDVLQNAEPIRAGITGADAAFATTGTLALVTGADQGRLPSLLPPMHIALLRRDRLVGRLEDWLHVDGRAALRESNSVVFISGPSRTSDIEMQTILGVHGPGVLHVVIF